ncbi:hypothetical protein [Bradyrhizobium sp. URHD0069]|uniref:hypothetical protein n=1 Tax=Bradyrhizobium sp. URHD0069 TaxID=1380355 RepID=UPI00049668C3|nr:hypothetical protein [Bradyrhizobium sp. URHD0069]
MSEDKPSEDKSYPLDVLMRLLDTPQLLPHENPKEFHQLFNSFEAYGKAQTARDYIAVYQATVLTWDILRYHEMKVAVLSSHQRPALESLLRRTNEVATLKGAEAIMKVEADQKAKKWFADPATRPAMMKAFELAGYPPNAVQAEAFMRALPSLAQIDRLIVSAQKRLEVFLKDLEKTSKASAEALRLAAERAVAAKASDQTPDVKK